jgi:hypothetical protein
MIPHGIANSKEEAKAIIVFYSFILIVMTIYIIFEKSINKIIEILN